MYLYIRIIYSDSVIHTYIYIYVPSAWLYVQIYLFVCLCNYLFVYLFFIIGHELKLNYIYTSSSALVFWLFAADFPWQSTAQCYFTKNLDILAFSELYKYKAPFCSRRFGSRSVVPPTWRLKKFSNNGADSNPSTSLASHSCNSMVEPWWYNRVTPPNPKCHCEKDTIYMHQQGKIVIKTPLSVQPNVFFCFLYARVPCQCWEMLQVFAWNIPAECDLLDAVTSGPQLKDSESFWKRGWFSPI